MVPRDTVLPPGPLEGLLRAQVMPSPKTAESVTPLGVKDDDRILWSHHQTSRKVSEIVAVVSCWLGKRFFYILSKKLRIVVGKRGQARHGD